MDKGVQRGEFLTPDGIRQPLLAIDHGGKMVFVRQQRECLSVFIIVDLDQDAMDKVAKLSGDLQRRVFAALNLQLMQHGRTAFGFAPPGARHLRDLRRVVVEQVLKIEKDDPATFNRFADSMQEVVTTTARAFSVFGHMLAGDDGRGGTTGAKKPPPSPMYG